MINRLSIGFAAAVLAAVVAVLSLTAEGTGVAVAKPRQVTSGSVEMLECNRGKRTADRNALFRAEMRRIPGISRMKMRFVLVERLGQQAWRTVRTPGLDSWRISRPGVAAFAYRQRIAALAPGTQYRVVVHLHWLEPAGATFARQVVRSAICRQLGPLPELSTSKVVVEDGPTPDTARYRVVVANRGKAAANSFGVALTVDGTGVDTLLVGRLGARSKRMLTFYGPRCAESFTVAVDPDAYVREAVRADNVRSFDCSGAPLLN